MLAPEVAAACRYGINAAMLNEASQLDRAALDTWLDDMPEDQYGHALKVHALVLSTRNNITAGTAR